MNLTFDIILVLCTLASMEMYSFAHFCTVFQNSKISPCWLPNQGECLDRLLFACAAKTQAACQCQELLDVGLLVLHLTKHHQQHKPVPLTGLLAVV